MNEKKYIIFLLIILLFFSACKKKDNDAEEQIDPFLNTADIIPESAQADESSPEKNIENTIGDQGTQTTENPSSTAPTRVIAAEQIDRKVIGYRDAFATDRNRLFTFRQNFKPIIPSDFEIGRLENYETAEFRRKKILSNIDGFFKIFLTPLPEDISNAEYYLLDESFIHPDSLRIVSSSMGVYIPQRVFPILYYRVGEVIFTNDGRFKVNIKIYKEYTSLAGTGSGVDNASVVGEIFFKEQQIDTEKDWLISEVNIDFFKLLEPPKKSTEKFLPGAYQKFSWE
ncbi:MAG: hypothetical protein JXR63_12870 [Spirochaetales bacterium]|nr:hypothetical protein [Spirochaetales bacterium]